MALAIFIIQITLPKALTGWHIASNNRSSPAIII